MSEAKVLGLAVGPEGSTEPLTREARDEVEFVEGKGVVGDKTFGTSPVRQVNLLSKQSYDWFERNFGRERDLPGGLGEQVVISGEIDAAWLDLGQRIQIGSAVLEVTTPRAPCAKFAEAIDGGKVSYFVGHVGVMCRVAEGGKARTGDPVKLLD